MIETLILVPSVLASLFKSRARLEAFSVSRSTGLLPVPDRRRFAREFKLEAVKLIKERGVSVAQVF
jgi:transposase-like protein